MKDLPPQQADRQPDGEQAKPLCRARWRGQRFAECALVDLADEQPEGRGGGTQRDDQRADLIAYLRTLSDNPPPLPASQ